MLELYVDPRSGFVAKRVMYDKVGSVVGSFEFTQVSYNPKFALDAFQINRKGARIILPVDELRSLAKKGGFPNYWLGKSSGLNLDGARINKLPDGEVLVQFYGAREARVTLFITKHSIDETVLRRLKPRESNFYVWRSGDFSMAIVGELSEGELRGLAGSIERF